MGDVKIVFPHIISFIGCLSPSVLYDKNVVR